ncbi:MAG: response regulator transcription factor, partial [Oscillospiraceae bacterium]|nr:response regulator transcription factor [Oscillospiraceae bacterium]
LETGADDYITKPFSLRELMARVKANIRRRNLDANANSATRTAGGLSLDEAGFVAFKHGKALDLSQKEFDLLRLLMASPGKVFSREALMEKVWSYDYFGDTRTVDVMVRRLREKLEDDPGSPTYILTRRGVGYYFSDEV